MHKMKPADCEDKSSEKLKKEIGSFRLEIAYLFFSIFEKMCGKSLSPHLRSICPNPKNPPVFPITALAFRRFDPDEEGTATPCWLIAGRSICKMKLAEHDNGFSERL